MVATILGVQAPPERGIEPVPAAERTLGTFDYLVLWGSLGVGLLVVEAGTFLADLGPRGAVAAVVLGSVIGVFLLAAAGHIGAAEGVPSMVLLRPVLGLRGSFLPSALNVLQLIGWTAFELWIMGHAAAGIADRFFGYSGPGIWIVVFAVWSTLLALGGPLMVVRQWLEKVGVWAMLAASLYLTYRLAANVDLASLLSASGDQTRFWVMVDLVIAMPVSWLPLVADYNRFARSPSGSFRGTFVGYLLANIWFFLLGVIFIMTVDVGTEATLTDLIVGILAVAGGAVALVLILLDETDNVFADIYSASVSIQNLFPAIGQRSLVAAVGLVGTLLAPVVTMTGYFDFLLLVGSVFVPLFGLLLADYFLVRRGEGYDTDALYETRGPYWYAGGLNWPAIATWAVGIGAYHWLQGLAETGALPLGASVWAFVITVVLYVVLCRLGIVAVGRTSLTAPR